MKYQPKWRESRRKSKEESESERRQRKKIVAAIEEMAALRSAGWLTGLNRNER